MTKHHQQAITIKLPIATVSEANLKEHWAKTAKRRKSQRHETGWELKRTRPPSLPLTVVLTRISPRKLDEGDNLNMSMKAIRDGIADWLGIDDGSDLVKWEYAQHKGQPKEQAVLIEVIKA